MTVVSNTSPITNLAAVGQLSLLQQLYQTIIIPQAVYEEMAELGYTVPGTMEVKTLPWIEKRQVRNRSLVDELQTKLDAGESEAIVLTVELEATQLLIDEYPGRQIAAELGLNFTGVLGVLLVAKRKGLISTIQPILDDLRIEAGFRVNTKLYHQVLKIADELR